jgi:hypothetical protein
MNTVNLIDADFFGWFRRRKVRNVFTVLLYPNLIGQPA